MAIIECRECKGTISDHAPACPHCGYPFWMEPTPELQQQCMGGCGRSLPLSQLVFINHCYHVEVQHRHRSCAGLRLLCFECHQRLGGYAYYAAFLASEAAERPDKYPWDDCLIGLDKYLDRLSQLTAAGLDPTDKNALEIAWPTPRTGSDGGRPVAVSNIRVRG